DGDRGSGTGLFHETFKAFALRSKAFDAPGARAAAKLQHTGRRQGFGGSIEPYRMKQPRIILDSLIGGIVGLMVLTPIAWLLSGIVNNLVIVILLAVGVPLFMVITGVGALNRQRTQQRRLAGLCIHCGYDIRANNDRCPECGKRITGRMLVPLNPPPPA